MKRLFVLSALSLLASTSFAAPVAGGSSSSYVHAASANVSGVGTAALALPAYVGGSASYSYVVGLAGGPIAMANILLASPGTGSAVFTYVSPWGSVSNVAEVWKNNVAFNTAVYTYRQIGDPPMYHPQFGNEVIAKVPGAEVYFGEWAPRKTGVQPLNSTDLNMTSADRTVWFVGENPTTSMPTLVNAKYNVVGINQYNPGTGAGITTGVLTANYGSGSGVLSGSVGALNFAGTTIASNGSFARGTGIHGQFYGANAEALAGMYTLGTTKVAFGGARQ